MRSDLSKLSVMDFLALRLNRPAVVSCAGGEVTLTYGENEQVEAGVCAPVSRCVEINGLACWGCKHGKDCAYSEELG